MTKVLKEHTTNENQNLNTTPKQIKIKQKEYAFLCKSDYELFSTTECDYDKLQFDKIIQMEKLAKHYDEILYLDFDVIPKTDVSFFQNFNLDNICVYSHMYIYIYIYKYCTFSYIWRCLFCIRRLHSL